MKIKIDWRKWIIGLLPSFALLPMWGQQAQTVYNIIGSGITTLGVQTVKPSSIGQSFHLLSVTARNLAGCDTTTNRWQGAVRLQGSFDNSIWQDIGRAVTSVPRDTTQYTTAAGSFPYLRVNYISGNNTVCSLDIAYSGNVTGSLNTSTISPISDKLIYSQFDSSSLGAVTDRDMGITCPANTLHTIYSISVLNMAAVAATSTAKIVINVGSGGPNVIYSMPLQGLLAGNSYVLQNGATPIFQSTNSGGAQYMWLTQAATDQFAITVTSRCE